MGRPDKYYSNVEPYLDKISEMALTMTERQIAEKLGVGYTSWKEYKKKYPTLTDHLKSGRKELVIDLKSTLIKKAKGYTYREKKIVKELNEDGKLIVVKEEIYEKQAQPDVAACNLLLKNYDKDNWANDPQALDLKRKELELKEKQIENNDW